MSAPFPDPATFLSPEEYEAARIAWIERIRTGGIGATGNWIGLSSVGPFASVAAGDTLSVTFATVAALKPEEYQDLTNRSTDIPESRSILVENVGWAFRTFGGEDANGNGRLDEDEDVNGNGRLDRYLIPEPPPSPKLRVEFEEDAAVLYWDRSAERARDPVTGKEDFEGYRIYRSNPGDDRSGDLLGQTSLVAQFDRRGNQTGFNSGFDDILLDEPAVFDDDTTRYTYRFRADQLLPGWQYAFSVTSFDEGDPVVGLTSFESARASNAVRVFPGTPAAADNSRRVGVYPNPYRVSAAWDGATTRSRRLNFYNLPSRAEVRIYSLTGEIVKEFTHDAASYQGDIRWYDDFSAPNRVVAGGEHSWDILSDNSLSIATGLYLFSVKDLDTSEIQTGKFVIIR
jgi:hypothetical protein